VAKWQLALSEDQVLD